jgi:membrane-associated protease RseP (regulator of RpoE activity)
VSRVAVALGLACSLLGACGPTDPAATDDLASPPPEVDGVDPALLGDLLGEAVQIDGESVRADGLLIRLAFEPLIRQTGPAATQLVQSQGYRLTGVGVGSPLWQLGLREGDVLTQLDGQPLLGREHEVRSIWERRPSRADLTFVRDGEARTLRLHIDSGSAWSGSARRSAGGDRFDSEREPSRGSVASVSPRSPTAEGPLADLAADVRCVEDDSPERLGRCEMRRATAEVLLKSPDMFARQARVVPAMRDGVNKGFKLFAIRPGTLPHLLGFANGDLITSANGRELSNPTSAIDAYQSFRESATLSITLERNGSPMTLEIELVDELD